MSSSLDALPTDPQPGSNLRDAAAGAAWTYLLDSLELDAAVCIGHPQPTSLPTLERIARTLTIVSETAPTLRPESFDLVYVTRGQAPAIWTSDTLAELRRALTSRGTLVMEASQASGAFAEAAIEFDEFWATPARGELRSAVPVNDRTIRNFFVRKGITVPSMPRPLRFIDRIAPVAASRRRTIVVRSAARTGRTGQPSSPGSEVAIPAYVRDIAARDGVDVAAFRFGLSARGRYSSRKVIFYLFLPGEHRPTLIAKTTRHPGHNARLANEEAALRHVAALDLAEVGTYPAVRFSGEHGGLRIVGEEAVDGELLSRRAERRDAGGAYAWLTHLGVTSARRGPEEAHVLRSLLEGTVQAVERAYPVPEPEARRLRDAAQLLIQLGDQLPVVMMHGDPTSGNAVIRADGRTAFLDWESAATDGIPLWDVFHFARSHLLDVAPIRRMTRRPRKLIAAMQTDPVLAEAVDRYVERLTIPRTAIEPLFVTGWAHRALKEVSRLPADGLARGHYFGLLRASLNPSL